MFEAKDRVNWPAIRNTLLVMLGFWIMFFLLVHWFIHALNKATIPLIGIQFGRYLAVQGAAAILVGFLYVLVKTQRPDELDGGAATRNRRSA
jgi:putative solute:sodium symporter small subunit